MVIIVPSLTERENSVDPRIPAVITSLEIRVSPLVISVIADSTRPYADAGWNQHYMHKQQRTYCEPQ